MDEVRALEATLYVFSSARYAILELHNYTEYLPNTTCRRLWLHTFYHSPTETCFKSFDLKVKLNDYIRGLPMGLRISAMQSSDLAR